MTTLMERIGNERRRLRQIRQNMAAALDVKANGDNAFVPFYIATADYIDATMQRVHDQDIKMGKMIHDKVESVDASVKQALKELDDRLDGARDHLRPFLAARDGLKQRGADALDEFETAARKYSDFIVANMGHHGATADLGAQLFTAEDWEYMAGITDEQIREEAELFERAAAARPDNVQPVSD
jgi:hypothetical protein